MNRTAISQLTDNAACNLALDTIKIGKQALIFNGTKRSAEKTAEDIAKKHQLMAENMQIAEQVLKALSRPTKQCERLAFCIRRGIAFHHAGLAQKQREQIEDSFRAGHIRIISATPTLAMGVDLPAFRSILKDMKRFGDEGMGYIPVLEYLQMAGRAGRPKFDSCGEAIIIANSDAEKDKFYDHYILGEPEDIYSKLAVEPVLRTYLLSLIAANFIRTKKQILDFFSRTFWAHQFEDMKQLERIIDKMLRLLEGFDFINKDDFTGADELSSEKYCATALGRRVAELYIDPLTAHQFITSLKRAQGIYLLPISFLQMISFTLELRPLLRVKVKEYDEVQQAIVKYSGNLVVLEPSAFDIEYEDYMASVKTALFFLDWIEENDEEFLLEKYSIRPGEIKAKLDRADWLLYSAIELSKLLGLTKLTTELNKTRLRMEYGVRQELLPLLKLKGIGRVRARRMFNNGIKDLGDVKRADITTLSQILGKAIALDVKEQVGEKVNGKPGNIKLSDYD